MTVVGELDPARNHASFHKQKYATKSGSRVERGMLRYATRLDDVHGLDDARGTHTGETTVHERLDGLPGGVVGERHGGFFFC